MGASLRPTLKDVAQAAGVSITTVSVVLNEKRDGIRVAEATRDRVRRAADELGYRPNQMARGLRQRSSGAIGFLSDRVTTTPFAVAMLAAAQEVAAVQGHPLFIVSIADEEGKLRLGQAVEQLVEHQVSTFVVAAMYHRPVEPVEELPASTVFVNSFATEGPYRSIVPDEKAAAYAAAAELLGLGHRRIAYLDDDTGAVASGLRLQGYLDAHLDHGVDPDPRLHVQVPSSVRGGVFGGELLDLPEQVRPTAVFCFNDRTAMGLYRAARVRGLRVPDDLSVIGFDDQDYIASELDPPLTTMRLPHAEMGRLAIEAVLGLDAPDAGWVADGGDGTIARIACPLVRRGSASHLAR
jgi:LacI family transcriptional regulator